MGRKPKTTKKIFDVPADFAEWITTQSKLQKRSEAEILVDSVADGFLVFEVNEEIQEAAQAIAKFVNPTDWGYNRLEEGKVGRPENPRNLVEFRKLRKEFGPIASCIDRKLTFMFGNDFDIRVDDKKDNHQVKAKTEIENLNRKIYQDAIKAGAKRLFRMLKDIELTEGVACAQIVYDGEVDFYDYVTTETVIKQDGKKEIVYRPRELTGAEWKKLKGVVQLKIIDDAQSRLVPVRDIGTYQILYFTLDANKGSKDKDKKQEPIRLHTWQVLWLSDNAIGTSLFGTSEIKKVYSLASLLQSILNSLGLNFNKWSKKRYFFVLGTEKRRWAPPSIKNFVKNVEEMVKKNGTGIPVPAGFDIKEIGGEVFEGRAVLDHFVDLIASGLKIPKSLVTQTASDENEQAWIGFMADITDSQKLFADDIERQLWQRHLNCIFGGVTRRVPKQGTSQSKQEIVPIFIPHMGFKTMGKWRAKDLINLLSSILNVANPVGPELKLVVEKLMAGTLEIFDADFNIAEQLLGLNQDISVLESEIELEFMKKAKEKKIWDDEEMLLAYLAKKYGKPSQPEEQPEEEKETDQEKRLEGGVSRETHKTDDEESKKGKAKPLGGTRTPAERKAGKSKEKGIGKSSEEVYVGENLDDMLTLEKIKAMRAIQETAKSLRTKKSDR